MTPHNCPHKCITCNQTEPKQPDSVMINGVQHISVRPACHPEVHNHPYVRGTIPQQQEQGSLPTTQLDAEVC